MPETIERGNLRIDPRSHEATLDGEPLALSPKEFALLAFFAKNPGQVFSRETLLDRVWGRDAFVSARTVDVHVRWLRTRIEPEPESPVRLLTIAAWATSSWVEEKGMGRRERGERGFPLRSRTVPVVLRPNPCREREGKTVGKGTAAYARLRRIIPRLRGIDLQRRPLPPR